MPTGRIALVMLGVLTWAVGHTYLGLFHDAGLYTLQALARLRPEDLGFDVFLRFGSQDRFTLWSPLYAALIRGVGVDAAAAGLTFTSQLACIGAAWMLVRALVPVRAALAGMVVLVAIPGYYGPDRIFTMLEAFVTPRLAAEALVLAGLAAWIHGRRGIAIAVLLCALLMHPLMALAGVAVVLCLGVALPRPRVALALVVPAIAVLALRGRFDADWLTLVVARSPYLFLAYWRIEDWSRLAVLLATLAAGARSLEVPLARRLCVALLVTVPAGLALTALGADAAHWVLATQLQTWRWQWLGTVVAALLLPAILWRLWAGGGAGRATCLILAAAWVFGATAQGLPAAMLALAALAFARRLAPAHLRLILWGAATLMLVALAWDVATNLTFTALYYLDPRLPLWMRRLISLTGDGVAPAILGLGFAWLDTRPGSRLPLYGIIALLTGASVAILPPVWQTWNRHPYGPAAVANAATLRTALPTAAEVFVAESPLYAWMLLARPSYLSVLQTSGLVFSRPAALELRRRAQALRAAVPPETFLQWESGGSALSLSASQLRAVCDSGAVPFLLTGVDLGVAPLATAAPLRLYRCQSKLGVS